PERSMEVEAVLLRCEQLAVDVGDRNLVFVDPKSSDRPRRDIFGPTHLSELGLRHLAERNRVENALAEPFRVLLSSRGDDPAGGGRRASFWHSSAPISR